MILKELVISHTAYTLLKFWHYLIFDPLEELEDTVLHVGHQYCLLWFKVTLPPKKRIPSLKKQVYFRYLKKKKNYLNKTSQS